jgi:hypothetical protein
MTILWPFHTLFILFFGIICEYYSTDDRAERIYRNQLSVSNAYGGTSMTEPAILQLWQSSLTKILSRIIFLKNEAKTMLDSTDIEILNILQGNGKITNAELARQIGMAPFGRAGAGQEA